VATLSALFNAILLVIVLGDRSEVLIFLIDPI
jgi:hypothetical protein